MRITIATCQFPVDADIRRNQRYVLHQMRIAKSRGAHVAHFAECALSGYAGTDFASYEEFDWSLLRECTLEALALARQLRLWIILGSTHRLTGRHKPHNSLYVVTNRGELLDRYDKMFCAGDGPGKNLDLAHYSPGNHFSVFSIADVQFGALICHDYRYPELYREYKRRGVQLMFHSYHAGHVAPERLRAMREGVGARLHRINNGLDPSRDHDACRDARGGVEQLHVDQLQQFFGSRKLLARVLRPSGRGDHWPPAIEYRGCPDLDRRHNRALL